jgi:pyruvate/2-oxoglutarate dehydrogenase complex dihydrolipoamide acyltransferase (E2) component
MRRLISTTVLAVICVAGAPSAADAQSWRAIPELAPPQAAAPAHAGLGAAAEVRPDFFSAAALETLRAERRSPLLLPAVGALVGAAGLTGLIVYDCSRSGECIIDPFVPALAGAVVGAAVGGVIELGLRVAGR